MRSRPAKPAQSTADSMLQLLMTSDQWSRYCTRVAELKRGGLLIAEARMQAQREVTAK